MSDAAALIQQLRTHGWQQGCVLPPALLDAARSAAEHQTPSPLAMKPDDWLIVISHSCDVRNQGKIENEPTVEVLLAHLYAGKPDSRETHGKNSRRIHFEGEQAGATVKLTASIHDRFRIDRRLLADHPPDGMRIVGHPGACPLNATLSTLITWVAKRYQRQAFPDEFNAACKPAESGVNGFLSTHAKTILGAYIIHRKLDGPTPKFSVSVLVVIKASHLREDWFQQREELVTAFEDCWSPATDIEADIRVESTKSVTLHEIFEGGYQKLDRDWISYEYDPGSGPSPES